MTKAEILKKIHDIENSERYAEMSEAGDDTLWYQIEALWEDYEMAEG